LPQASVFAAILDDQKRSCTAKDRVVLRVCADPEPEQIGVILDREGPLVKANADRPKTADLLEVERRMP
jgi:hypothetical protein